jgi:succinate-semialdehyde dehydrogenase / glutarate-semialdehyde dehydrogenase
MSFQTINPATGETLRTFPMASGTEVAIALKTADDRYNNDWKLRPVAARAQIVKREPPRCSDRMPASTPAI